MIMKARSFVTNMAKIWVKALLKASKKLNKANISTVSGKSFMKISCDTTLVKQSKNPHKAAITNIIS